MSYKIVTNKIGTKAVLRVYGNTNISVNALSVGSQEIVGAATLTQIYVTSNNAAAAGYWRANTTVGNNAILKLLSADHGYLDFSGVGVGADFDLRTANIIFTVPGDHTDTVIVAEFHKLSSANTEY
jgi:hypothetical protein